MSTGASSMATSRRRLRIEAMLVVGALVGLAACGPEVDQEFPPGDPTLGATGAAPIQIPEVDDTNYVLWAVVAFGLIVAGALLVSVERWERRRADEAPEA